jgi:CRISPR-associated endonuclease Cas2
MTYLISYDISHSPARSRVLKVLRQYSEHYQKSVLECELPTSDIENLIKKLEIFIEKTDGLLVMPLHGNASNWQLGNAVSILKASNNVSSLLVI